VAFREMLDGFKMRRITYFLIAATVWTQFDDTLLAPASALLSAPLASDDDDYVSSGGQEQQSWLVSLGQRQSVSVTPQAMDLFGVGTSLRSKCKSATLFSPPPICVFMSLQI
jgi:hypothetical protein